MKLTLGKTKWQRFESITLLVVIFLGLAGYGIFKFIASGVTTSGEDTKKYVESYIAASLEKEIECRWAGYAQSRKTDLKQVFVQCRPLNNIPVEINNEEQLHKAIDEFVVSPAINALPLDEDLSIVTIMQIDKTTVTCNDVRKGKLISQWMDTYENYCWPL